MRCWRRFALRRCVSERLCVVQFGICLVRLVNSSMLEMSMSWFCVTLTILLYLYGMHFEMSVLGFRSISS